jgi:hypothetical protein
MWPIIIVILTVAMLVGPILLMQPSRSQKRLAALRRYASAKGVRVSASSVKTTEGELCWFYWLPLLEKSESIPRYFERKNYEHGMHVAGVWALTPEDSGAVPGSWLTFLTQLPASVYAAEANSHAVGVHWAERGGQETLDVIATLLTELVDSL